MFPFIELYKKLYSDAREFWVCKICFHREHNRALWKRCQYEHYNISLKDTFLSCPTILDKIDLVTSVIIAILCLLLAFALLILTIRVRFYH